MFQLAGSWWRRDSMPFPSMGTLAVRCGVSERQIQRAINHLVDLKLIERVNRRTKGIIASNAYDLAPLVEILGEIAKVFPNEFPRNVNRATAQAVIARLTATGHLTAEAEVVKTQTPQSAEQASHKG
jgi:hypothetical protein